MITAFLKSAQETRIELSPSEMLIISQSISREFAPRFSKNAAEGAKSTIFSSQELLAISLEIRRDFSPLPSRSRSNLVLLPIDPHRLHAYWHLAETSSITNSNPVAAEQKAFGDEHLTLRIFTQSKPLFAEEEKTEPPPWFDIAVDRAQSSQEVVLPNEASVTGMTYCAAIGVSEKEGGFAPLVYSNAANMPQPQGDHSGLSEIIAQFITLPMNASSSIGGAVSSREI